MIVKDVGGNPDAVENEKTGLVVPAHHPDGISEGGEEAEVGNLIKNADLGSAIKPAARYDFGKRDDG